MPSDTAYWDFMDFESDESASNTFPRNYVDPWDLENYAYIRQHIESLDVSSEQSSFGEPVDANSSFYFTVPNKARSPPTEKSKYYESLADTEYGTAR